MSRNRLTVITPSFNQARFIRRTIDSVLSQDVPGLEYLVFDGVSTDDTPDILREYGDRLTAVIEHDAGPGRCRQQRACARVRGRDWMAQLG